MLVTTNVWTCHMRKTELHTRSYRSLKLASENKTNMGLRRILGFNLQIWIQKEVNVLGVGWIGSGVADGPADLAREGGGAAAGRRGPGWAWRLARRTGLER